MVPHFKIGDLIEIILLDRIEILLSVFIIDRKVRYGVSITVRTGKSDLLRSCICFLMLTQRHVESIVFHCISGQILSEI